MDKMVKSVILWSAFLIVRAHDAFKILLREPPRGRRVGLDDGYLWPAPLCAKAEEEDYMCVGTCKRS